MNDHISLVNMNMCIKGYTTIVSYKQYRQYPFQAIYLNSFHLILGPIYVATKTAAKIVKAFLYTRSYLDVLRS